MYLITILLVCMFAGALHAETYYITFTDKGDTAGVEVALSEKALQRRAFYNIPLDERDVPICKVYRDSVLRAGCIFLHQSRWLNGMTVAVEDTACLPKMREWQFVKSIERTQSEAQEGLATVRRKHLPSRRVEEEPLYLYSDVFAEQTRVDSLHKRGYLGEGMTIAVLDDGFVGVDQTAAFGQAQILDTKDFVEIGGSVYATGEHGTMVLSTLTAEVEGAYQGVAPRAQYYLLRSEDDATESVREVDAMVAAMEYADSVGADIITASLGYTTFDDPRMDYTYAQHDGKSIRTTRAALIASTKGMMVCIAAGNEGARTWHYISSPADADNILAVGAVNGLDMVSSFSSYGPSSDGRIKPDVCALGESVPVVNGAGRMVIANGTSFATPIVAGVVACLWQAHPQLNNLALREAILQSASRTAKPDNRYGYGIVNVWKAHAGLQTGVEAIEREAMDWTGGVYYSLQGMPLGTDFHCLPKGIVIQRKNGHVRKLFR